MIPLSCKIASQKSKNLSEIQSQTFEYDFPVQFIGRSKQKRPTAPDVFFFFSKNHIKNRENKLLNSF